MATCHLSISFWIRSTHVLLLHTCQIIASSELRGAEEDQVVLASTFSMLGCRALVTAAVKLKAWT